MRQMIDGYYDARESGFGAAMRGVGLTAEAIENNPAMFELLCELPWRAERFDAEAWTEAYAAARYGASDPAAGEAWRLLLQGPYDVPADAPGDGAVESIFCARPALHLRRASTWGHAVPSYPARLTAEAARHMIEGTGRMGGNPNYLHDLTDILRQALSDRAYVLYEELSAACDRGDREAFDLLTARFLGLGRALDRLLSANPGFRLDEWLAAARSLSDDPARRTFNEWNARTLITVWGPRPAADDGGLHDYSQRVWGGLLGSYYLPRWEHYFETLRSCPPGGEPQPIDFFPFEEEWCRRTDTLPRSDAAPLAVAREVYGEVRDELFAE